MSKIDWHAAQKDYIEHVEMSMAKIALKYGVSEQAVKNVARKYGWRLMREETYQKVNEKLPEKISDQVASYRARKYNQGKVIAALGIQAVIEGQDKMSPYVGVMATELGHKLQTEALDLDKPATQINIQQNFMSMADFVAEMHKRKEEREKKATIVDATTVT